VQAFCKTPSYGDATLPGNIQIRSYSILLGLGKVDMPYGADDGARRGYCEPLLRNAFITFVIVEVSLA